MKELIKNKISIGISLIVFCLVGLMLVSGQMSYLLKHIYYLFYWDEHISKIFGLISFLYATLSLLARIYGRLAILYSTLAFSVLFFSLSSLFVRVYMFIVGDVVASSVDSYFSINLLGMLFVTLVVADLSSQGKLSKQFLHLCIPVAVLSLVVVQM